MSTESSEEKRDPKPKDSSLACITTENEEGKNQVIIYDQENETAWIQVDEWAYMKEP